MSRQLLAGLVLVMLTGVAQANPPSTPGSGRSPAADAKPSTAPRELTPESATSKPTPLAQASKPDDRHKLNSLKVYPCF